MPGYSQIHNSIWGDDWFIELEADEKLLFIYLFSNERISFSGIYKISQKQMAFETSIERKRITEILQMFQEMEKVYIADGYVMVANIPKYHATKSETILARITRDLESIPECEIKQKAIDNLDTLSIPYPYHIDRSSLNKINLNKIKSNKIKEDKINSNENDSEFSVPFNQSEEIRNIIGCMWSNNDQPDQVDELVKQYGIEKVRVMAEWCKTKKMRSMNQAINAMFTAAPTWGQRDNGKDPKDLDKLTSEERKNRYLQEYEDVVES